MKKILFARLFLGSGGRVAARPERSGHTLTAMVGRRAGLLALVAGGLLAVLRAEAALLPTGFAESTVASGLAAPTAMAFAPDGRLFVCEQGGKLRVIKNGILLTTPFLTLPVDNTGERGLLGVAFDPGFATNHFVYVYYTATSPAVHNRISRFTANGDVVVSGSEAVLLDLDNLGASNHNGGGIHFGSDGKLYAGVGENATPSNSQTLANLLGKLLRLNADGTIPTDNPFYSTASGVNRAIWAMGLRNPFTFAFQPGTGRLFINDVGQDTWEEIDEGVAGANYGWPNCEGACSPPNPSYREPLFYYPHGAGTNAGYCIAGGAFYNPAVNQFPSAYLGVYFFADYVNGWIRKLDPANGNQVSGFATGINAPVDLQVGPDGQLYYLAIGSGTVSAIGYTGSLAPQITQQPVDQTVLVGDAATFNVTAAGTPPLGYQWQRDGTNIVGASASSNSLAAVSTADDGSSFRCVVTNASGAVTSNPALLHVTTSKPPVGTITSPPNGLLYAAGDTIPFAGTATDTEDGNLPDSAFSWTMVFHHNTHTHPYLGPTNGVTNGSFVIPTQGETATNVWYRINLTVSDSAGQTQTTFADVRPRTANITLLTSPPGLQVTLDGQPVLPPVSIGSVVGMERTLGAISPQTSGGTTYQFVSWSDGGAATHTISSPAADTSYTATYQALTTGGTNHFDFTYPDRSNLLAARWDFLARTAAGATRNTEQTTGAIVSYDQAAHPGTLRIPVDVGDLWVNLNSTRNSLFRDVPTNWTSLRLKLSFAPTQNYQQAGLVVYQNDDNYVQVTRIFENGNTITFAREMGGSAVNLRTASVAATSNLHLRLDRNAGAGTISGYYSLDGATWVTLGNVTQTVATPRLGIIAGASPGGFPNADIAWAEVIAPPTAPLLMVSPGNLTFSATVGTNPASQILGITNGGGGTLSWTAVADGSAPAWLAVTPTNGTGNGTAVVTVTSAGLAQGTYNKSITVAAGGATNSPQTLTVTVTVSTSNPSLSVKPTALNFSAVQGTSPAGQVLGITNLGGGTLNWAAVADGSAPAWLAVNPTNGTGNGTAIVTVASAGLAPGTYNKNITVTAGGASNSPQTVTVTLAVNGSGTNHFDFTYPSRASLLAAGWDLLARTAAGATRNTEQTSGAVISYDQTAHPGTLRIPVDTGDLWGILNSTRNSVFRDLPPDWTSVRLKLSFAPTQNYQQAGLVAYQNDDNYVQMTRIYNSGNKVSFARETGGSAVVLQSANVTAKTNLHFRLDRNVTTGTMSGLYSLDGKTWVALGNVTQTLTNARLGVIVGASPGGFPNADIIWAEVVAPPTAGMLALSLPAPTFPAGQGPLGNLAPFPVPGPARDKFGFAFLTQAGVAYTVEYKTALSDPAWTVLTNLVGTGLILPVTDSAALDASRFYRVRAVP
jgi:glucose/arabinose dehydrogenase/regulation of enolase protein 1 (concanavalin A-like superfamily)